MSREPTDPRGDLGGTPGERPPRAGHAATRTLAWILLALGALLAFGFVYGCVVPDACENDGTCPRETPDSARDAGRDAAPATVRDACPDAGTDDGSCGPMSDVRVCDPASGPHDDPCVLDEAYGVFVAATGTDGGEAGASPPDADGSRSHPYPTITQALANLGPTKRIYVCNGLYPEQVSVTSPVSLYGGLSCTADAGGLAWSYAGGVAQVTPPSASYALAVTGVDAGAVTIEDLAFVAPNAVVPGGSSIGAWIVSSWVTLRRVVLQAGDGADGPPGANGEAAANYTGVASSGGSQVQDLSGMPVSGGPGGINRCAQYGSSAGGDGGLGCAPGLGSPSLGTAGTADPPAPLTTLGRDGVAFRAALADGGTNTLDNDPGADGTPGEGGAPAPPQDYGTLSSGAWLPSAGGDGAPGNPGQGGAGATDPLYGSCAATTPTMGETPIATIGGGGGGAGGCGGAGGKGGGGGGASLALVADDAIVTLQQCVLRAGAGGAGGPGGTGQAGQAGGAGGDEASGQAHAQGAAGGNGAGGSGGAGGTGGISVAVLYRGNQIMYDPATSLAITFGLPGAGGAGGPPGKHPITGLLTTGSDGLPGGQGRAGTSAAFLQVM